MSDEDKLDMIAKVLSIAWLVIQISCKIIDLLTEDKSKKGDK